MAKSVNKAHQESLAWHEKIAVRITTFVGSMFCALLFSIIALVSLPAALATHNIVVIIGWIAQTFLQLVLLSIIMVGQNLQQRHAELVAEETYEATITDEVNTTHIIKELDEILRIIKLKK